MNIPSNEENDDFILDSLDSKSLKEKKNSHSLSVNICNIED